MDLPFRRASSPTSAIEPLFLQDGIQECLNAHQICLATLQYCLQRGGSRYTNTQFLGTLQSCAEITAACARLLLIQSDYLREICLLTAKVCDECALKCETFSESAMLECSEICQDCAEICRRILF